MSAAATDSNRLRVVDAGFGETSNRSTMWITLTERPDLDKLRYQVRELPNLKSRHGAYQVYLAVTDGLAFGFVKDPSNSDGFYKDTFKVTLTDGSEVSVTGPWSGRADVYNTAFPELNLGLHDALYKINSYELGGSTIMITDQLFNDVVRTFSLHEPVIVDKRHERDTRSLIRATDVIAPEDFGVAQLIPAIFNNPHVQHEAITARRADRKKYTKGKPWQLVPRERDNSVPRPSKVIRSILEAVEAQLQTATSTNRQDLAAQRAGLQTELSQRTRRLRTAIATLQEHDQLDEVGITAVLGTRPSDGWRDQNPQPRIRYDRAVDALVMLVDGIGTRDAPTIDVLHEAARKAEAGELSLDQRREFLNLRSAVEAIGRSEELGLNVQVAHLEVDTSRYMEM